MLNLFSFLSESEIQVKGPISVRYFWLHDCSICVSAALISLLIQDLMTKHYKVPEKRLPQKKLAEQLTLLVHGEEGLQSALTTTDVLYYQDISALAEIPGHEVSKVFQQVRK